MDANSTINHKWKQRTSQSYVLKKWFIYIARKEERFTILANLLGNVYQTHS
jgi:hypothetical protein